LSLAGLAEAACGSYHIPGVGDRLRQGSDNLCVLQDVKGVHGHHARFHGQMVGWIDQDEPADRHVFHGPGHSPNISRMLRFDQHHPDVVESY
jgi:hypothetical protein